ncbi:nuclear receptor coactivator 7 [Planoprotostelium fungivorum]|uniref:Nuclear receptor coactivator 7 n=1 Tax=Planoprotostelium fungivorum TaxID=1890364 RepID=A0A2P6N349_9EUKA|nr:nuclear receptor coactivator 7 [Planoprotostelium fungivorum]
MSHVSLKALRDEAPLLLMFLNNQREEMCTSSLLWHLRGSETRPSRKIREQIQQLGGRSWTKKEYKLVPFLFAVGRAFTGLPLPFTTGMHGIHVINASVVHIISNLRGPIDSVGMKPEALYRLFPTKKMNEPWNIVMDTFYRGIQDQPIFWDPLRKEYLSIDEGVLPGDVSQLIVDVLRRMGCTVFHMSPIERIDEHIRRVCVGRKSMQDDQSILCEVSSHPDEERQQLLMYVLQDEDYSFMSDVPLCRNVSGQWRTFDQQKRSVILSEEEKSLFACLHQYMMHEEMNEATRKHPKLFELYDIHKTTQDDLSCFIKSQTQEGVDASWAARVWTLIRNYLSLDQSSDIKKHFLDVPIISVRSQEKHLYRYDEEVRDISAAWEESSTRNTWTGYPQLWPFYMPEENLNHLTHCQWRLHPPTDLFLCEEPLRSLLLPSEKVDVKFAAFKYQSSMEDPRSNRLQLLLKILQGECEKVKCVVLMESVTSRREHGVGNNMKMDPSRKEEHVMSMDSYHDTLPYMAALIFSEDIFKLSSWGKSSNQNQAVITREHLEVVFLEAMGRNSGQWSSLIWDSLSYLMWGESFVPLAGEEGSPEREADKTERWTAVVFPEEREENHSLSQILKRTEGRLISCGILHRYRNRCWRILTGCEEFNRENPNFYEEALHNTFGCENPPDIYNVPLFGGRLSDTFISSMDTDRLIRVKKILCVIATQHPDLTYAPYLPNIVFILSDCLIDSDVYVSVYLLLGLYPYEKQEKGREITHPHAKFTETHDKISHNINRLERLYRSFELLADELLPDLKKKDESLLLRITLTLYQWCIDELNDENILRPDEFIARVKELIEGSRGYKIDRKRISETTRTGSPRVDTSQLSLFYRPKNIHTSRIVTSMQFEIVYKWLPSRFRILDPKRIYDTSVDGYAVLNVRDRCVSEPQVWFIKTHNEVLGAFVTKNWKREGLAWFGERDNFLFRMPLFRHDTLCDRFTWKEGNSQLFQNTEEDGIQMGGPQGGLCLDREMYRGKTRSCSTFENEPLTLDGKEDFICVHIEIYSFV